MSENRAYIDQSLVDLEARIKRRGKWRGKWVFYQVLESELAPLLKAAEDPAYVRERVAAMLVIYQHEANAPPLPEYKGDLSCFCRTFDERTMGPAQ
jgi:hypothetical protein